MIKHIDERKIERAFGGKATCHSYGVATVKELNNKFQERLCNYGYSTIVLHVGTNDLVKMMPSPSQKIPIVLSKMMKYR